MSSLSRRSLLRALGAAGLSLPFSGLLRNVAHAGSPASTARRLLVFYFPDGIPEPPDGEPSQWHMSGSGKSFALSTALQALAPYRDQCVFFNNLTMGSLGEGAHPQGAQKLLTGTPDPSQNQQIQGPSIDQYLARTVGQSSPFPNLYLGAQATVDSLSSDAFISYSNATSSVAPTDNPFTAWSSLFAGGAPSGGGGSSGGGNATAAANNASIFNAVMGDLTSLQAQLGTLEQAKLQAHLDALNQLEKQVTGVGMTATSCTSPASPALTNDPSWLSAPENFPAILQTQMSLMVQAMACNLTRVGVLQCSQHTTNLIMSRFAGTPMYAPAGNGDMRSHQASHYGNSESGTLYTDYVLQVTWWASQYASLLGMLKALPEPGGTGTMLDHSLVVLCTEICNGSTHNHSNMPFVLAGGGGGAINPAALGTVYDVGVRNHADLLTSLAIAMGDPATSAGTAGFGQGSTVGGLPGLLST